MQTYASAFTNMFYKYYSLFHKFMNFFCYEDSNILHYLTSKF